MRYPVSATPRGLASPTMADAAPAASPKTRLAQQELAERWGISPKTLERWRVLGIGPVFMKLQGRVVYRLEDIEAYESKCLRSSTSQANVIGGAA